MQIEKKHQKEDGFIMHWLDIKVIIDFILMEKPKDWVILKPVALVHLIHNHTKITH